MRYFLLFITTIVYLLIAFFYPNAFKIVTYDVSKLFINVIIPSIIPMYIITSLLVNNKFFIKISNLILKPLSKFESYDSASILISSILVGNPTSTIITINKYCKGEITLSDTKILLSTSFINPLFIISSFKLIGVTNILSILFLISLLISNLILLILSPNKNLINRNNYHSFSIFETLNNLPNILLNIFIMTLFVGYLKIPLYLKTNFDALLCIPFEFIEITTGINNISNYNINTNSKIIICSLLLSSTGLSIILQSINFIKQKVSDKIRHFTILIFVNRLKIMILTNLIFLFFLKLFF